MKNVLFMMTILATLLSACQNDGSDLDQIAQQKPEKLWMIKTVPKAETKAIAPTNKLWWAGQTIKIKFLNGDSKIQAKVKQYAALWLKYANLRFEYVNANDYADVKIGFDTYDNYIAWSTIGIDCKSIDQDKPSLNFVWLQDETDESIIKGEVLRAFGLVLGLSFEHQNPNSTLQIKPTADIAAEYNLTTEQSNQIRQQYSTAYTNFSEYDKSSIMVLDIPRTLLVNPREYTPANKELSEKDINFIDQLYPGEQTVRTSLAFIAPVGAYIKGWIKLTNKKQEVLHQFTLTNWSSGENSGYFYVNAGEQVRVSYELYLSRDAKNVVKSDHPYVNILDSNVPYPYFDTFTGRISATGDYFLISKFNDRFQISFLGFCKPGI